MKRFNHLYSSDDPISILHTAKVNSVNMNGQTAVDVMKCLFEALKKKSSNADIIASKEFTYLCEIINQDVRRLEINDVVNVLKIMTYLNVPSETVIVQTLLQMIRTSVNELSIQQVSFIYYLLSQHERTALVEALLTALPLVFDAQLDIQLDRDDINSLTDALLFSSKIRNTRTTEIVVHALSDYEQRLDVRDARTIHHLLSNLEELPVSSASVIYNVQRVCLQHVKDLTINDICGLLKEISRNLLKSRMEFYNEYLIDALTNAALALNISFPEALYIANKLNRMNYSSIPLLDYLAAKCFEDPSIITTCTLRQVQCFVKGFALTDYKPVFWDIIRETLLASTVNRKFPVDSVLDFVLDLTALDCYHSEILEMAFRVNIMEIDRKQRDAETSKLLNLYQTVKTLYPSYTGAWPDARDLESVDSEYNRLYSLTPVLARALGGVQYVQTHLRTKLGHFVDHVVVMQPGGQPVAINNENDSTERSDSQFVEDLISPPESRTILIFVLPADAYSINCQRLKSTWSLRLRSAEALTGFSTIAINSHLLQCLPERERVQYVKQAIRLKCDDVSTF